MQQQLASLWEHVLGSQKGTYLPEISPNLDSSLLSHGSEHTVQNGMINNNYDIDKNPDFIINLLNPLTSQCRKMVRHTLKILQQMLKDF